MIAAIGLDVDPTFAAFIDRSLDADLPIQVVNLRAAVDGEWKFDLSPGGIARFDYADTSIALEPECAFYCRIIDMSSRSTDPALTTRWLALANGLQTWLEFAPGRVVNRWRAGVHNGSKPLHEAVLSELGFRVPESVTTSDPGELSAFLRPGPAISKPVCGVRADSCVVTGDDFRDFEPASGPVHLQRLIPGGDARIHVIGDRIVAQRVAAGAADYRRAGAIDEMELFEPERPLRDLLVDGTKAIGLEFAGWDFKIDQDGQFWCLEANPMPGYSPYDDRCGGAISGELIQHLSAWNAHT